MPDMRLRLGLLKLTDSAPLIVAKEHGFFAAEGLDVALSVEPSWANIADKLTWGLLDGAIMLPPLAIAISLGLRGTARKLVVPMSLSLNGNTITLSRRLATPILSSEAAAGALDAALILRRMLDGKRRPLLAVVHAFSTHNLLLRYWLAAGGIDAERDVRLTVVPPAQMVDALGDGRIDGFCAGAPWGELAARAGIGRTVATSQSIWNNGPEKAFAVPRDWAEANPEALQAALRALIRAAQYCDDPANAESIASLLAQPTYLGVEASAIRASLPGAPRPREADVSIFFANTATYPWRSHAMWFVHQMARWGYLGHDVDAKPIADELWRPDLYALAAGSLGVPVPLAAAKSEGTHAARWTLEAIPAPVAMGSDLLCDGTVFDLDDLPSGTTSRAVLS
jgi:ABC-type nitrate/sulfonate/bicarbonate transport system substrate-binding protein